MYGGRTAGMLGYSHFTGGYAGGQAEYVRVAYGDVNLLKVPDKVPDEKAPYLFSAEHWCLAGHRTARMGQLMWG
jgi:threonine dehydrogenase-like Zn-dependent dehydrogenase